MPFNKPNNIPLYINKKSNHPPRIISNIPQSINRRLLRQRVLRQSSTILSESPRQQRLQAPPHIFFKHPNPNFKNLREKIGRETSFATTPHFICYNPSFSKNVSTNIGLTFLKLFDAEFTEEHVLHKIFNRNTVKISYSCMPNLKQNIDGHSKSILHKKIVPPRSCNCRVKTECPLSGNCLKESVVYQGTVSTEDHHPPQTYVGLTENSFKTRYSNHKSSFANANKTNNIELSKYIWYLKENLTKFKVTWRILKDASSYNPTSNRCNLCLWEKYFIICKPDLASLNKRNELISSCRHAGKYALKNFTP